MAARLGMKRSLLGVFGRLGVVPGVVEGVQLDDEAPLADSRALRFQRGMGALETGALKHSMSDDEVALAERCGNLLKLAIV